LYILKIFVPGAIFQNYYVINNVVGLVIDQTGNFVLAICDACGSERNVYVVLVGKPEGKRQLRRLRNR
jgi:hypothetical protein